MKSAVITGGASGIGATCARQLVDAGCNVVIADVQTEQGELLARELGVNCQFVRCDVRALDELEQAVVIAETRGDFSIMVNNAAVGGALGPVREITSDQFDLTIEVVFRSVFYGVKLAAKRFQERGAGRIVNVASAAGLIAGFSPHLYAACKAAVIHFTRSVALELSEDNIQVNAVCPGNTETPFQTGVRDDRWRQRIARMREDWVQQQAIGRIATPEEIAAIVVWLGLHAPSFMIGHAVVADGGLSIGRPWHAQPEVWKRHIPLS